MVERHWDKIGAEFALAEGGGMSEQDGAVKQVLVTATEKLSRNLKVVAHGVSAHGSVPRADNPLLRLSAALLKLAAWPAPMRLNEVTRAYFSRLATISPTEEAFLYTGADPDWREDVGTIRAAQHTCGNAGSFICQRHFRAGDCGPGLIVDRAENGPCIDLSARSFHAAEDKAQRQQ